VIMYFCFMPREHDVFEPPQEDFTLHS
jgi:hypothetical protein